MLGKVTIAPLVAALLLLTVSAADAATATLKDTAGVDVGTVVLTETPAGVLLEFSLNGLPEGEHAVHVHTTGACTPDFSAAGDHLTGGAAEHGMLSENGPHAGDMPNLHIPESGSLTIEILNAGLVLHEGENAALDEDGAAIIIHADPDDYQSQPTGNAGGRIACGVIEE